MSRELTAASLPWFSLPMLLLSLAPVAALAEVDAREIVRRAVAADERNWTIARGYGFSERVDARRLDSNGRLKSKDVKSYDVLLVDGSPYRRLSGRGDHPLPPGDEKKEQDKLAKSIAERLNENAAERARRLAGHEGRHGWLREAWQALPEAFDFRLTGEATDGLYVIEASQRRGFQPRSRTENVLASLQGRLWVDKLDYRLVKAEMEAVETISMGLFLVRLAKGSRAAFEQTRVSDLVWLPARVQVSVSARLGLLKVVRVDHEVVYSGFQAGSPDISQVTVK
jgi:hypothetical protein